MLHQFVCLLFLVRPLCAQPPRRTVLSPDRQLVAIVENGPESAVEIRDYSGLLVARKSYVPRDGERGASVDKIQWTKDSRFLVFSLSGPDGRQSWRTPVDFFSRKKREIYSLEARLGWPITSGFDLIGKDQVAVTVRSVDDDFAPMFAKLPE